MDTQMKRLPGANQANLKENLGLNASGVVVVDLRRERSLAEAMIAAMERGDKETARRRWEDLRQVVLSRPVEVVKAMERQRGLS